jgi:hypothetical protein
MSSPHNIVIGHHLGFLGALPKADVAIVPQIMRRPLPSTSLPGRSLITLSFDAIYSPSYCKRR